MKKLVLTFLALTLTLAACGNNNSAAKTEEKIETDSQLSTTVDSELEFPYTYTDAAGREITIEKEITSIAVDYLPLWESLMLLGVQPTAASGVEGYVGKWNAFEGYDLTAVKNLGNKEVNLEVLAEVNPDLILTQVHDVNNIEISNYEKVGQVAVFDNKTKMDWKTSLREMGKLVGKPKKAEEVIKETEAKLADAKVKLDEKYKDQTVMQVSVMGLDNYHMIYRDELYGENGLGLNTPEGFATGPKFEQISIEAIAEMNPDYLFVNVFYGDDPVFEEMQSSSVWQNLDCVKNGRVYNIGGSGHAMSGLSTLYTVDFMIDKLLSDN